MTEIVLPSRTSGSVAATTPEEPVAPCGIEKLSVDVVPLDDAVTIALLSGDPVVTVPMAKLWSALSAFDPCAAVPKLNDDAPLTPRNW